MSIKSQSASQRLPGFVTLRLDLCVSDRDGSTYADCDPGRNTAEGDNGLDGDDRVGRGQLLVGFRVPGGDRCAGVVREHRRERAPSPATRATRRGLHGGASPRRPGFRWEGYSSTELPFDPPLPDDRTTRLEPEFVLPPGGGRRPVRGTVPVAGRRRLP